jgi:hypothetical protein
MAQLLVYLWVGHSVPPHASDKSFSARSTCSWKSNHDGSLEAERKSVEREDLAWSQTHRPRRETQIENWRMSSLAGRDVEEMVGFRMDE